MGGVSRNEREGERERGGGERYEGGGGDRMGNRYEREGGDEAWASATEADRQPGIEE